MYLGDREALPSLTLRYAQIGSDGCKPENRDILSDFSESRCVLARLAPAKPPAKRWQVPIDSPPLYLVTAGLGLQFHGLLFVGRVDRAG